MPFIGQDWRSPGDQWVRNTEGEGWEKTKLWRVKIFAGLNENAIARINRLAQGDVNQSMEITSIRKPHIMYSNGSSKEKKEFTSFSESIVRLDMAGAVRDIRRANYMTKLMSLILKKKFSHLSGTSQKLVLNILECMVNEAIRSELNYGIVKNLLKCAMELLKENKHNHIGSHHLWAGHIEAVNRLTGSLEEYHIKERNKDGKAMLSDLPTDCLRVIFSQIPDHKDVLRAGQTNLTLNEVTDETLLWKEMSIYHFSDKQVMTFVKPGTDTKDIDWKYIYKRCYKRFGQKDSYADMLAICLHCCGIHWKSLGHPCINDASAKVKDLSPEDFMGLLRL